MFAVLQLSVKVGVNLSKKFIIINGPKLSKRMKSICALVVVRIVVSVLAYNQEDPSLNPAELYCKID